MKLTDRLIAAIVCMGLFLAGNAFADGAPLLKSALKASEEKTLLNTDEQSRLATERQYKAVRSVTAVRMDAAALTGNVFTIAINGKVAQFAKTMEEQSKGADPSVPNPDPSTLWYGKSAEGGDAMLMIHGREIVGGTIKHAGAVLLIRPLGRYLALVDVDTGSMREHSPTWTPESLGPRGPLMTPDEGKK